MKAAEDLLAYREAAKKVTGEREGGKYAGANEADEETGVQWRKAHLMNVNDKTQPFTDQILDGEKTIETRDYLYRPWTETPDGRIGLVRTGKGESKVVGSARLVRAFRFTFGDGNPRTDWKLLRDKTKIAEGDERFDWNGTGEKWGYEFDQVNDIRDNPVSVREFENANYIKGRSTDEGNVRWRKASLTERTTRTAPNGKRSNLTDFQYDQVRTPKFKEWAGDWENGNGRIALDGNGEPLVVYHGSNRFGTTVFDKKGMMFTTDSLPRATGYGGPGMGRYRGFSRLRHVEKPEWLDMDSPAGKIADKAESVLGADVKVATNEDKARSFDKLREVLTKYADRMNALEGDPYLPEEMSEFGNRAQAVAYEFMMDEQDWNSLREAIASGEVDGHYLVEMFRRDLKDIHERYKKLGDEYGELRDKMSEENRKFYDGIFNSGYENGDALIDAEYSFRNLLDKNNDIMRSDGTVVDKKRLVDAINENQQSGVYGMFVDLGDNPLVVDANGAFWTNISFNGKEMSTDAIGEWAKGHGYTSVRINNVQDPGVQNADGNNFITFNPSQVKSATDNSGEFSRESGDVLWRRYRVEAVSEYGHHIETYDAQNGRAARMKFFNDYEKKYGRGFRADIYGIIPVDDSETRQNGGTKVPVVREDGDPGADTAEGAVGRGGSRNEGAEHGRGMPGSRGQTPIDGNVFGESYDEAVKNIVDEGGPDMYRNLRLLDNVRWRRAYVPHAAAQGMADMTGIATADELADLGLSARELREKDAKRRRANETRPGVVSQILDKNTPILKRVKALVSNAGNEELRNDHWIDSGGW